MYTSYFINRFVFLGNLNLNYVHKGHILDDGRLEHHHQPSQNHMASIYGAAGALRSNSSNSSSPGGIGVHNVGNAGLGGPGIAGLTHGHTNTPAALLVVPQPINATKIGASLSNGPGTGRKYQCKMCPQVSAHLFFVCSSTLYSQTTWRLNI